MRADQMKDSRRRLPRRSIYSIPAPGGAFYHFKKRSRSL